MSFSSGVYFGSHSTVSQVRSASARVVSLLVWIGPLSRTATSTTVAILMWRSDLFPGDREGVDERCIDRGDAGALGRIAAGGEGADAPVVHAGTGGHVGRCVS